MKAITTKYHGSTNTLPSRIIASDSDGNKHTIHTDSIPTDIACNRDNAHSYVAFQMCKRMGWSGRLVSGELSPGIHCHVFDPDAPFIKTLTCGCCTNGCCCVIHMDIPHGRKPNVCAHHKART